MNKLDMESKNLISNNINKLKNIFPTCFIDDKLDFEALRQELSEHILDDSKEKYQMTWPGKKGAIVNSNTRTNNTLRPNLDKSLNFQEAKNIYIEGDNLEVLKILQESYLGKIKCIFIDPPYNTGNDFIYNDNYKKNSSDELIESGQIDDYGNRLISNNTSNGKYHSDWLTMFYSRIKLARNLLSRDGLIFVSLDDHENYNARKIMNEIFGENNFVCEFIWEKKKKPSFLHKNVGKIFDYILCYSKDTDRTEAFSVEKTTEGKKYPFNNAGNGMAKLVFPAGYVKFQMDDGIVKAQDMSEGNIKTRLLNDLVIKDGYNENEFILEGEWRYSQERLNEIVKNNEEIVISKIPFRPNHVKPGGEVKKMKNFLSPSSYKCETNEDASSRIVDLFGYSAFDTPKPVGLIELLIKGINLDDNDIVLDFFAGSSTTAEAVLKYNRDENKNVRFMMIQIPELLDEKSESFKRGFKSICDIGEERIKLAIKDLYKNNLQSSNIGFRTFYVDSSNMKDVYYKPNELSQLNLLDYMSNIKDDRTSEDLLTQVILDLGLSLDLKINKKIIQSNNVYFVENNSLIACFDDKIDISIIDEICKYNPLKVVFKDISFKTDKDKINLEERIKKLSPDTEISIL